MTTCYYHGMEIAKNKSEIRRVAAGNKIFVAVEGAGGLLVEIAVERTAFICLLLCSSDTD